MSAVWRTLDDIIFLTLAAVLAGCESWDDIEFGHTKEAWLRGFVPLENGIPFHDTINRVFATLTPDGFQPVIAFHEIP